MRLSILKQLILPLLLTILSHSLVAQEKDEPEPALEEIPVEERDTADSFIENLGEVPGKIITFPLILFFNGVAELFDLVNYNYLYLRAADLLTSEDGTRQVRPAFTPNGGGGLTLVDKNFFRPSMTARLQGSFGTRTRRSLIASVSDPMLFSSRLGMHLLANYVRRPDEDFFGVGNESPESDQVNYLYEETNFEVHLSLKPLKNTQLFAGFSYDNVNIENGRDPNFPILDSLFSPTELPGFNGAKMGSFVLQLYHDTRNQTGNPTAGGEEYMAYEVARQLSGSEFGYQKFTVDLHRYIELFYGRVLTLQIRSEISMHMRDREIPFYSLSGLGGSNNLRGYRPVRFREDDMLIAGLEYRFPVHHFAVAYVFAQEGRVFRNMFEDFGLRDFKSSFGGGLRFIRGGNLMAIFEIAKSKEQIRFVFALNTELRRLF